MFIEVTFSISNKREDAENIGVYKVIFKSMWAFRGEGCSIWKHKSVAQNKICFVCTNVSGYGYGGL